MRRIVFLCAHFLWVCKYLVLSHKGVFVTILLHVFGSSKVLKTSVFDGLLRPPRRRLDWWRRGQLIPWYFPLVMTLISHLEANPSDPYPGSIKEPFWALSSNTPAFCQYSLRFGERVVAAQFKINTPDRKIGGPPLHLKLFEFSGGSGVLIRKSVRADIIVML